MKRNTFGLWQVIIVFAAVGIVMVFVQRDKDKAPLAEISTPATPAVMSVQTPMLPPARVLRVPTTPYAVPKDGKLHDIRITVVTDTGNYDVYAEQHKAGERVQVEIPSVRDARIRFYDNAELRGEAKL